MLSIFRHKGKLTFRSKGSEVFTKTYRIKNIAIIKYAYSDYTETDLFIKVYSKQELKRFAPDFYNLPPAIHNEVIRKFDSSTAFPDYKNIIEINGETEENIPEIIMSLAGLCSAYKICLLLPEQSEMMFGKYMEWQKQREAVTWWKEDIVFKAFSKN